MFYFVQIVKKLLDLFQDSVINFKVQMLQFVIQKDNFGRWSHFPLKATKCQLLGILAQIAD